MGARNSKSNNYLYEDLKHGNTEQSPTHFITNHDLIIFGFLRQIYEDKYDVYISMDIKLLCGAFYGISQCCMLNTNYQPQLFKDDLSECVGFKNRTEFLEALKVSMLDYAPNDIKPENINITLALFIAAAKDHHRCLSHLLRLRRWNNPMISYGTLTVLPFSKRYRRGFESISLIEMPCRFGSMKCMMELMQHPSKYINGKSCWRSNPMRVASCYGHYEMVDLLLQTKKFNINEEDSKGRTALYSAARNNHVQIAKLLLNHNADVNKRAESVTDLSFKRSKPSPLFVATEKGHTEIVRVLLEQPGIKVNERDFGEPTPLFVACMKNKTCMKNKVDIVKLLLSHNADVNKVNRRGVSPLSAAAWAGHTEIVRILLAQPDINIDKSNYDGVTPLFAACMENKVDVVKILLLHNADVNKVTKKRVQCTPLYIASHKGHIEVVRVLLTQPGIDISKKMSNGNTASMVAAQNGHLEICALLESKTQERRNKSST